MQGTSRGHLLVSLGGVQAPVCGWKPGGCIYLLTEVRQDTGKALSLPAWSVASFCLCSEYFLKSFGFLSSDQFPHLGQSWEGEVLQGALSNAPHSA